MNRFTIIGNVGNDPKPATKGNMVQIGIATTDRVKSGEAWVDETNWHDVTFFGKQMEFVLNHVKKGSSVLAEGQIKYYKVEGEKAKRTSLKGSHIQFVGSKRDSKDSQPFNPQVKPIEEKPSMLDDLDSVPF